MVLSDDHPHVVAANARSPFAGVDMMVSVAVRRASKVIRNAVQDARYGALLGGTITTRYPDLDANDTANSGYDAIAATFGHVPVFSDDVIVDVGCGKGRAVNWFLSRFPRQRIVAIELDPDICLRTSARLARFTNVTVQCGDAVELLPEDGTIFYLFNPFGALGTQRFIDAVKRIPRARRERRIVYYNPAAIELFRADPAFDVEIFDNPGHHRAAVIHIR